MIIDAKNIETATQYTANETTSPVFIRVSHVTISAKTCDIPRVCDLRN